MKKYFFFSLPFFEGSIKADEKFRAFATFRYSDWSPSSIKKNRNNFSPFSSFYFSLSSQLFLFFNKNENDKIGQKNEKKWKLCGNNEFRIMNDVRHAVCLLFITFFRSFRSFSTVLLLLWWLFGLFELAFWIFCWRRATTRCTISVDILVVVAIYPCMSWQSADKHAIFDQLVKSTEKLHNKITTKDE